MNIVLFTDTYLPEVNGVATSVNTLYNTLLAHNENVYVVTSNPYNKKIVIDGRIIRLPGIKLKFLYDYVFTSFYSRKVFKIIKKLKPDIIHVHADLNVSQFGRIVAKKLGIPLIYTYHTMYEDYSKYATHGQIDRFAKYAVREYTRIVTYSSVGLISPSIKTKNYLRRIGVNGYIDVVPTGINIDRFANIENLKKRKAEFIFKHNIDPNGKILLSLGRLGAEKSVDILIDFFGKFMNENKENLYLVIAGDGPLRASLEKESQKFGLVDRIIFIGKINPTDTPFYYNIADLFVAASVTETQGLTYIEALASSKPVLARFDSNLASLIKESENGFFFKDYTEFSNKLKKFLSIDSTYLVEMAKRCRESVEPYSLESFYQNIMEVYRGAIRRNY